MKLTKSVVDRLEPSSSDQVFWDTQLPGFGVRLKPSGSKSYVVQYRHRETGRSRRRTIGQHGPLLSFAQAKTAARDLLADVIKGLDPVGERRARRTAPTVADLAAQYLEIHAVPKKRKKSVENDRSILNGHILPRLAAYRVAEVSQRDIQLLHNAMAATPYQANRALALLSKMFELAAKWGLRQSNPAKGIQKFHEERRDRWLNEAELRRLLAALDAHPNQMAANAIRLQILTGARIGEVLRSRWSDFDFELGRWTKPSHHTKQKRTEHLPLSSAAIELLKSMRERAEDRTGHVFPGRVPGRPLVDLKRFWASVTTTAGLTDYRIHDNRHTHASHLVSSGMSLPIVGRLLGHTNPATTQRYAHLADDPLREAAEVMGRKFREPAARED